MSTPNSTPSAHGSVPSLEDLAKIINARRSAPLTPKPTTATKSVPKATTPTPNLKVTPAPIKSALRATAPTPKATPAPMSAFDKAMSSLKPTDPDYVLTKFAELYGSDSDESSFSNITSPSPMDTDDEQTPDRIRANEIDPENFSGHHIPTPDSFVEPRRVGFQPTHVVILAGQEVGIFTSCHTTGYPPFSNGFFKWSDAVDYYGVNYHNNNVKIITAPGSTYDPIAIASDAPTPIKKPKVIWGVESKTIRRAAPGTNTTAGPSKKTKTVNTVTASSSASSRTAVVRGKKRACPASPTPTANKREQKPAYSGKVVNVSDYVDSDE